MLATLKAIWDRLTGPRGEAADGPPAPAVSPQLVRLSSESVMAAWAGVDGGHWAIRSAPIDQRGLRTVSTISAAQTDAVPAALAPGPRGEAVMLLSERDGRRLSFTDCRQPRWRRKLG